MKAGNYVFARFGSLEPCSAHVMHVAREVQVVIARDDQRRMQLTLSADEAEQLSVQLANAAKLARLATP